MYHFKSLFVFSVVTLILFSCKEDEAPGPDIDNCVTISSAARSQPVPGEYIITFPEAPSGGRTTNAARLLKKYGLTDKQILTTISGERLHMLTKLSEDEAEAIRKDNALTIEPERITSICGCLEVVAPSLVTWNVNKVGYGDGTGKTAWILDTGIDLDHPDLNVDKTRSRSFLTDITSAEDDNGHGTHVAGIVGAKNNTFGTLGVAAGASLISLKILDKDGNGRLSAAIKALAHVRENGKAGDVVNISLTLEEVSEALETEIRAVAKKGIFVAIAAGNDKKDAGTFSPARTSGANIYTVSAVDSLGNFAEFSNYGAETIDYAAPGVSILSSYKNGKYAIISGTSMASPHVAGLLLISNGKLNSKGFANNDPDGNPDPIVHR